MPSNPTRCANTNCSMVSFDLIWFVLSPISWIPLPDTFVVPLTG